MSLTIAQQKKLYDGYFDHITDIHLQEFKKDLCEFTINTRSRGEKGIVLLDYTSIKDMILLIKQKLYLYKWIPHVDATKIKSAGVREALLTVNPKTDCILVCSLQVFDETSKQSNTHLYINCVKFKNI